MHAEDGGRLFALTDWTYRQCMRLYPHAFRKEFAFAMREVFRHRWFAEQVHTRRWRVLGMWWFLLKDLATTVPAAHRSVRRERDAGRRKRRPGRRKTPIESAWRDLSYAIKVFARKPAFTGAAILTLAMGIGANSAIFTVINDLLLHPLPFEGGDRIVYLMRRNARLGFNTSPSAAMIVAWRKQSQSFDAIETYSASEGALTGGLEPRVVSHLAISPTFMSSYGIRPLHGRAFVPQDGEAGQPLVAILSEGLWRQNFGADPGVIGTSIVLNDTTRIVVGVRPSGFELAMTARGPDVWTPLPIRPGDEAEANVGLDVLARLRPEVPLSQAQAELDVINWEDDGAATSDWKPAIITPQTFLGGGFTSGLWVLLGAVGFVLLIACANVANMILARGMERGRELGVRIALGASRTRIVQFLLAESVVLCAAGGLGALLVARWGLVAVIRLRPDELQELQHVGLDPTALLFTLGVTILTGVLFGLLPALRLSDLNVAGALRAGTRFATGTAKHRVLRQALVTTQVALALVVFVGAGLMAKSFYRLQRVDPGFDPTNLGTMRLMLPEERYPDPAQQRAFFETLLSRVRQFPTVETAVLTTGLPPRLSARLSAPIIEGRDPPVESRLVSAAVSVAPGYFNAVVTPVVRGRVFTVEDQTDSPSRNVIVNRVFAQRYWPDSDPIGGRFKFPSDPDWHTVIGVVDNVKAFGLRDDPDRLQVYYPMSNETRFGVLAIRGTVAYEHLVPLWKEAVWSLDPNLPIREVFALDDGLAESIAREHFTSTLFTMFAALALALATIGVYGVVTLSVTQRMHGLGVRMALGAGGVNIVRSVVMQGLRPVAIGIAIGLPVSLGLSRFVESLLHDLSPKDPGTFIAVPILLGAVATLACLVPARRATRVDPIVVLRSE